MSLLEVIGHFYGSYKMGGFGNEWTIYLTIIPFINVICWFGFWMMRKATIILFFVNICFTMWVHYCIGIPIIEFYSLLYILIAVVILRDLHKMDKFI